MPSPSQKSVPHLHHHKDGSLWAQGNLKNGKMDGAWTWFRKDGTKMRSGKFTLGKQIGIWITYKNDGTIVKKTNFGK